MGIYPPLGLGFSTGFVLSQCNMFSDQHDVFEPDGYPLETQETKNTAQAPRRR